MWKILKYIVEKLQTSGKLDVKDLETAGKKSQKEAENRCESLKSWRKVKSRCGRFGNSFKRFEKGGNK